MAQERSAVAVEAFASGIAAAIISHYNQPAPKGKVYPPCPDVRVHAYFDWARWFPVAVNPFAMLESVLLAGIAYEHLLGSNDNIEALDVVDRENLDFYVKFRNLRPSLHMSDVLTKLATPPEGETDEQQTQRVNALDHFIKALDHAADSARESDTSIFGSFTKGVGPKYAATIVEPTPQVIPAEPSHRGFNDRTCGRELCPHELVEEYDADETLIEDFAEYRREVRAGDWPTFAYSRSATHDARDIRKGLFDAVIMYIFAMHIVCGPKYAVTNGAEYGNGVSRGTLNGYVGIEPEIMAYVAVQVWYFYSSATKWRAEIGAFNLATFHRNIVALFADRSDPWVIATFARWNSLIKAKPMKSKPTKKRKRAGATARASNDPRETAGLDLALQQAAAAIAAAAAAPVPPPQPQPQPLPPPPPPPPDRPERLPPVIDPRLEPGPSNPLGRPLDVTTPPQPTRSLPPPPETQHTREPFPSSSNAGAGANAGTGNGEGSTRPPEGDAAEEDANPGPKKRSRKNKPGNGAPRRKTQPRAAKAP